MKDKRVFKYLFSINMAYANPVFNKVRKKNKSIAKYMMFNSTLGMLIVVAFFGGYMYLMDFARFPVLFDMILGLFAITGIIQNLPFFYNIFYESKDAEAYMSLPIEEETIFLSKIALTSFVTIQTSLPIGTLFVMYFIKIGIVIPSAILLGIAHFMVAYIIIMAANVGIMLMLGKMSILGKLGNKVVAIVSVIGSIIQVGILLFVQFSAQQNITLSFLVNREPFGYLSIFIADTRGQMIFLIAGSIIGFLLAYFVIIRGIKTLYYTIRKINNVNQVAGKKKEKSATRATSEDISVKKRLFKQNLSNLNDGTLLAQVVVTTLLPALIVGIQFFLMPTETYLFIDGRVMLILIVVFMAGLNNNLGGIASISVSLDREMFSFIKVLPIDRKDYLDSKLNFCLLIQSPVAILTLIVLGIIMNIEYIYIGISVFILLLLNYSLSRLWIIYDYKHVMEDWLHINEILNRMGKVKTFFATFIILVLMGAVLGLTFALELGIVTLYAISIVTLVIFAFSTWRWQKFLKEIR